MSVMRFAAKDIGAMADIRLERIGREEGKNGTLTQADGIRSRMSRP
jgi:hypothetical protein